MTTQELSTKYQEIANKKANVKSQSRKNYYEKLLIELTNNFRKNN